MKKRLISGFLALTLLAPIAQAAAQSVPMKGSGAGSITSATPGPTGVAITAIGEGKATHLGRFTREENILLDPVANTFTGTIVFTAADGSELNCNVAGAFTGPGIASGTYTFTGGTGRFVGATGVAYFSIVQLNPANFTFQFVGTIEMN